MVPCTLLAYSVKNMMMVMPSTYLEMGIHEMQVMLAMHPNSSMYMMTSGPENVNLIDRLLFVFWMLTTTIVSNSQMSEGVRPKSCRLMDGWEKIKEEKVAEERRENQDGGGGKNILGR